MDSYIFKCNKEGSYNGLCCCLCEYQIELKKHPWNKLAKGNIYDIFGWACLIEHHIDECNTGTFFEQKHGFCEMFQYRKKTKIKEGMI